MRILVVEDERKVASFIAKGLQEEGYAVDVQYDGEAGAMQALSGQSQSRASNPSDDSEDAYADDSQSAPPVNSFSFGKRTYPENASRNTATRINWRRERLSLIK